MLFLGDNIHTRHWLAKQEERKAKECILLFMLLINFTHKKRDKLEHQVVLLIYSLRLELFTDESIVTFKYDNSLASLVLVFL